MSWLPPLLPLLLAASCARGVPVFPGPPGVVGGVPRAARIVTRPSPSPQPVATAPPTGPSALGPRIGLAASHYLSHPPPDRFRNDCSGYVGAVLDRVGVPVSGNTEALWAKAVALGVTHRRPRPSPGDLVFFDDTYDRDRDGRVDDPLTHVGVVLSVDEDDTITVAHVSTSKGRTTLVMNLRRPGDHVDERGRELNSFLRARAARDGPAVRYLAGELFRGFATVLHDDLRGWSDAR